MICPYLFFIFSLTCNCFCFNHISFIRFIRVIRVRLSLITTFEAPASFFFFLCSLLRSRTLADLISLFGGESLWASLPLSSPFHLPSISLATPFLCPSLDNPYLLILFDAVLIFYCLAGTTLIREEREVFLALDRSLEEGRKQVARIVGRDTSELSAQEVRTAALETLAENLSDGVIAPLFWYTILGVPGMLAYKMINTLDSMIGYKTERYRDFGCWAAHIDDIANYIPARLTALLMVIAAGKPQLVKFVWRNGRKHASPNSGYPEAALAGILNCRFGGPHYYFGELFDKPYIGENARELTTADMQKAVRINRTAEVLAIIIITVIYCL